METFDFKLLIDRVKGKINPEKRPMRCWIILNVPSHLRKMEREILVRQR
jgi:hypothetical protein